MSGGGDFGCCGKPDAIGCTPVIARSRSLQRPDSCLCKLDTRPVYGVGGEESPPSLLVAIAIPVLEQLAMAILDALYRPLGHGHLEGAGRPHRRAPHIHA